MNQLSYEFNLFSRNTAKITRLIYAVTSKIQFRWFVRDAHDGCTHIKLIKLFAYVFFTNIRMVAGDAMNSFINDNWKHVIKDMKPVLEQTIGDVVKDLFNGIYTKFPLEEILPY